MCRHPQLVQVYPAPVSTPQRTAWRISVQLSSVLLRDLWSRCCVHGPYCMPGSLEGWWCETLLAAFFWLEVVNFMTYGHEALNKRHGKLVDEHPNLLIKRRAHSSEAFLVTTSLILVDRAPVVHTSHLLSGNTPCTGCSTLPSDLSQFCQSCWPVAIARGRGSTWHWSCPDPLYS